jgi:type IV secretory pathway protease TraF
MKGVLGTLLLSLVAVLGITAVVHTVTGRRFYTNIGVSLVPGWYACTPFDPAKPIPRGTLVQLDPSPDIRHAAQRLGAEHVETPFWMKALMAQEGDAVCLQGDTVTLQGAGIAHRPLLQHYPFLALEGCWTLGRDDIFVLGTHPKSYDSRYTGPWYRSMIHGTCEAIWTREAQS